MAITTLDGAIAGAKPPIGWYKATGTMEAAGVPHSLWRTSGAPPAAAAPASGINGEAMDDTDAGCLYWPANSGNTHLMRLTANAALVGTLMLCDRLWQNSGITVTTTTSQAISPVAIPARDADGTTNGRGVYAAIEVQTATTNGSAVTNTTISYTDEAGNTGATGSIPNTRTGGGFPATAAAGTFVPFDLASGDNGVRSVQSITLGTSYGGGAISLVLYRPIVSLSCPVANVGQAVDFLTSGAPRLYDDSCLFLVWLPSATTTMSLLGEYQYTQG